MPKGVVNMARGSLYNHHHPTSLWGQVRAWAGMVARHPYGRWVLVSLVLMIVWLYWNSLMQHGSFAPFVPLFTMSSGPPSVGHDRNYACPTERTCAAVFVTKRCLSMHCMAMTMKRSTGLR